MFRKGEVTSRRGTLQVAPFIGGARPGDGTPRPSAQRDIDHPQAQRAVGRAGNDGVAELLDVAPQALLEGLPVEQRAFRAPAQTGGVRDSALDGDVARRLHASLKTRPPASGRRATPRGKPHARPGPGEDETNCASKRKRPSGESCCDGGPTRDEGLAGSAGDWPTAAKGEAGGRCRIFHPARTKASTSKAAARRSHAPDGLKFKCPPVCESLADGWEPLSI
jgi:hypothetical protein